MQDNVIQNSNIVKGNTLSLQYRVQFVPLVKCKNEHLDLGYIILYFSPSDIHRFYITRDI